MTPEEQRLLRLQRGQAEFLPGRQAIRIGEAKAPFESTTPVPPPAVSQPWWSNPFVVIGVVGVATAAIGFALNRKGRR